MKFTRTAAAAAATALVTGTVGVVAVAAPAQAAPASSVNTQSYTCVTALDINGTFPGSPADYEVTLSVADDELGVGDDLVVTAELTDNTPTNGPVTLNGFTNNLRFSLGYSINGGAATTLDGAYNATTAPATIAGYAQVTNPGPTTVTIPAAAIAAGGTVTVLPTAFRMEIATTSFGGDTGTMTCTSNAAAANALTVEVAAPSFTVTGNGNNSNAPAVGRTGDQYPIALANLAPNATVDLTAVNVIPGPPVSHDIGQVTTDASGAYVGLSPAIPASVPTGTPWRFRADDGTTALNAGGTSDGVFALYGDPTLTFTSPMAVGAKSTVTGTNWDAGQTVTVKLLDGDTAGTSVTAVASTGVGFAVGGTISVDLTPAVGDLGADSVEATQPRKLSGTLSKSAPVTIDANTPPTGDATVSSTVWVGNSATLTLSNIEDNASAAGDITATVDWGDGSAVQVLAAGATTATHKYPAAGTFDVTVTLEDEVGAESSPIEAGTVTVTTPAGNFTRTPSILWATQAAKITPSGIGADVNTVSVNWGDGTSSASVSKTAATSHVYKSTGWKTITVTFKNTATGNTYSKAIGRVAVYKDTYKPIAGLANPKNATKGSSWTTIKGTIVDKGLGPKAVTVQVIQKRGSSYYYSTGSGWKKASSKSKALAAAKKITDTTVGTKTWAVKIGKPKKGGLYVYYSGVDRANNKSAVKTKSQWIKS